MYCFWVTHLVVVLVPNIFPLSSHLKMNIDNAVPINSNHGMKAYNNMVDLKPSFIKMYQSCVKSGNSWSTGIALKGNGAHLKLPLETSLIKAVLMKVLIMTTNIMTAVTLLFLAKPIFSQILIIITLRT